MRHLGTILTVVLLVACGRDPAEQQVTARNLTTGEVKSFDSADEVPDGWSPCSDADCTVPPQVACDSLGTSVCELNPECRLKTLWCAGTGCACAQCPAGQTCPPCDCPPPAPDTCQYTCIPKLPLLCEELTDEQTCTARPDCSWGQFMCPEMPCQAGATCPPCPSSCVAKAPQTCQALGEADCKARPDCAWGVVPCTAPGCANPQCIPASPTPVCKDSDCPQLGMPNYLCPDGKTMAGPTGKCLLKASGTCGWEVITCPQ